MPVPDLFTILQQGQSSGLMPKIDPAPQVATTATAPLSSVPATAVPAAAPAAASPTQAASPALADLTYFGNRSLGGVGQEEVNSTRGQTFLTALQKYDPNAQFQPSYGSDGQLLGYSLYYDPSKLPGANGSGVLGGTNVDQGQYAGGSAPMTFFSTVQDRMQLANPNLVYNSPVYGKVTDNRNIMQPSSLLDIAGPALVSLLGLWLGGAPSFLQQLAMKTPSFANSIVNSQQRGG